MEQLRRLATWKVWALGAIPLMLLVWDALAGNLGVDPVPTIEHRLGRTALYFLMASLSLTPLLRLGRVNLMRHRRALGLLAASYAGLHALAWAILDLGLRWEQLGRDILKRPYLTLGFAALVILAALAATSPAAAIRRMGARRWKSLHSLVYAAAPLAGMHWLLSHKIWPAKGKVILLLIAILLVVRLAPVRTALEKLTRFRFMSER